MQTDVGSALPGHPDVTAVLGKRRRALGAAGKEPTCIIETGNSDNRYEYFKDMSCRNSQAIV